MTGALEVADRVETMRLLDQAQRAQPAAARPLLSGVSAHDLTLLGVTQEVADQLVQIADETAFYEVADTLPRAQSDAVLDLAAGKTPEQVWTDLVQHEPGEPIDTADIQAALARPLSRLSFVPMEDADEFRAALEGDLEAWRVWLHPLQRAYAYRDGWHGPFRLTGGAGTGKTVTAIHRAAHLADRLTSSAASDPRPTPAARCS